MKGKLRWWIIGLVTLGTILNYLARSTLSVTAPTLKTEFAMDTEQYSWVVLAFQASYTVMQTVAGSVLDALGTRLGFAIFAFGWALANMAHALATGTWSLAMFRAMLGATEAAAIPAVIAVSSDRPAAIALRGKADQAIWTITEENGARHEGRLAQGETALQLPALPMGYHHLQLGEFAATLIEKGIPYNSFEAVNIQGGGGDRARRSDRRGNRFSALDRIERSAYLAASQGDRAIFRRKLRTADQSAAARRSRRSATGKFHSDEPRSSASAARRHAGTNAVAVGREIQPDRRRCGLARLRHLRHAARRHRAALSGPGAGSAARLRMDRERPPAAVANRLGHRAAEGAVRTCRVGKAQRAHHCTLRS